MIIWQDFCVLRTNPLRTAYPPPLNTAYQKGGWGVTLLIGKLEFYLNVLCQQYFHKLPISLHIFFIKFVVFQFIQIHLL